MLSRKLTNCALIRNACLPMRGLKLHEYQAGALLHSYQVPIPIGSVAFSAEEALQKAKDFGEGHDAYVVKAQVLGGGRGLGHFKETGFKSGVHIVDSVDKVHSLAKEMVGNHLITAQSGDEGFKCSAVYIVEKLGIEKEMYLSVTLDRGAGCPTFIYSPAGGMAIEEVAHNTPDEIFKMPVNLEKGLDAAELQQAAINLGCADHADQIANVFQRILDCFVARDCDMVEINPLVLTTDHKVLAADSKITVDSNAEFRQKDLFD